MNIANQNFNTTKTKNDQLKAQLNELRKKTQKENEKVNDITKKFIIEELDYKRHREDVEKKLKQREDQKLISKIEEDQRLLEHNNNELIEQIKISDKGMNQKLAMKKLVLHEKRKLDERELKIEEKWEHERNKFYSQYSEQIENLKNFDPQSKILEALDKDKLQKIQDILNLFLDKTNLTNVEALVDYFIKCTKEFNNFENFIEVLKEKVATLEKEVDELDFVINFCERNSENTGKVIFSENEAEHVSKLKKAISNFIHLQYNVIHQIHDKYCKELHNYMLSITNKENEDKTLDFISFMKEYLDEIQDRLREAVASYKDREKGGSFSVKHSTKNADRLSLVNNAAPMIGELDFNEVDSKFGQKLDKIKDSVRKDFDKNKDKQKIINLTKIKGLIDPLMNEEKDLK